MFAYALTIFIGAFLLFQVQPLIGKYILPWFGGATGVWTTCLLFFQVLLLGGYAYAHFAARWLRPRTQAIVHFALLVAALALLPITPADSWKPDSSQNPTLLIFGLLMASIGLPYFVLSTTGPLMQSWFSQTHPGVSPFRLYALSNIGSLLALVSYPVFFETQFTRLIQARLWGWGLAAYAIACTFCVIKFWRAPAKNPSTADAKAATRAAAPPPRAHKILWLLLPACASVLLLATTNKICQEVAVIPFLWVLPLSLYLLSFIICFDSPRWYARFPFALALVAAWGGICWTLFKGAEAPVSFQLGIYSTGFFICCMICHGELYRLKPDPAHLTGFYLMIAAGGALGGIFVAVVAPLIFTDYFELQWGLLLCGLLFQFVCLRERKPDRHARKRRFFGNVRQQRTMAGAGLAASLIAFGTALWVEAHQHAAARIYKSRNFYGVLTVFKHGDDKSDLHYLELSHGRVIHGVQFLDPLRAAWPTLYYSGKSGVGLVLHALPTDHRRIGLVGLGVGTLAAYARAGDYVHAYEINPEVQRLADLHFTYLTNCPAKVEVTLGDARLSLEREPPQDFDLLALDAFNSDAIPIHLLTQEAFGIYERHLKTNGIIAIHVSNRSVNLEPVIINLARQFNYNTATVDAAPPADQPWISRSVWMLLSRGKEILDLPTIRNASRPPRTNSIAIPLWTDDFASLFQVLQPEPPPRKESEFSKAQLGVAQDFYLRGDFAGAFASFRLALHAQPDSPILLNNLAFLLATCPDASLRNYSEAVQLAERACQLTHYQTAALVGTLAAIYSEAGRFPEAIAMTQKACYLASESGEQALLEQNRQLLELYRTGKAFHESTEGHTK